MAQVKPAAPRLERQAAMAVGAAALPSALARTGRRAPATARRRAASGLVHSGWPLRRRCPAFGEAAALRSPLPRSRRPGPAPGRRPETPLAEVAEQAPPQGGDRTARWAQQSAA